MRQSKGIEGTYYYIVKALEDPKWRSRFMIPLGAILAIFGLGIMLPNEIGGVVIGALPLVLGLYIFSKGAGIESTVNRVIQEMRENADAAMFSSLLWTAPSSAPSLPSQKGGAHSDWQKERLTPNRCCGSA